MGDILGDLSNAVPQLRDIAGELNKVSGTMSEIGSRTKSAGSDFRDLYGGEFDRMTTHAKAFNLAMRDGQGSFVKFKKNLHQIEEGFGLMRAKAVKELGVTGKFFGDVFKRMEQTGKGFASSLGKEIINTFKGMANELLSFKNVFSLTFSVISASVGIVYKVINGFIDAIKKGWEITTKWLNELYAASGSVAQSLGLSTKSVGHLRGQIESLYISNMNLADSMADIANAASEAMQAFREVDLPKSLIEDIFKMGKSMGFTNTQASKLSLYLDKAWGVKGSKERKIFVSEQLQFAEKIGVPYKEITGTLTDQLDLVSRLGNEGVIAIHRLGAASKSFGVSQEKIIANMAKFDTLEETIPTINKINLLTGAAIDPFLMFAETDPAKKFAHMFEQIRRGVGDFKNLDKWTKLSLANISGFTESEMEMIMSSGDVQKKIEETMKKGEGIKKTTEAWNDAVIAAKSFFVSFDRSFRPLFSQISKIFMGLAPTLVKSLEMVLKGFGNFLNGATSPIKDLLFGEDGFSSALENWAEEAMKFLSRGDIQEKAANFIRDMKKTFIEATGWINKMIDALKERLPGLMDQFRTFFNTVVDKIKYVLEKIEKHNVLGTLESGAKLLFKAIDFIVKNKTTLLTLFGAFKAFSFVSAIQNGAMASRNLRNIAQLQAIGNVTNQTFKTADDARNAAMSTGLGENFAAPRKKGKGKEKHYVVDYNYPSPTAADRRAQWWGSKFGRTTRAGFAGGLGMAALTGATQIATGNVAGGVGAIAGGAIGAIFGPMGAMLGSTIGSFAGPALVKLFDKNAKIAERQEIAAKRMNDELAASMDARRLAENKLEESLGRLTKGFEDGRRKANSLFDGFDYLKRGLSENGSTIQILKEDFNNVGDTLKNLADAGFLTKEELDKLSQPGGSINKTNKELEAMIKKIADYNWLEELRIKIISKSPEIIEAVKKKKEKLSEDKILKDQIAAVRRLKGANRIKEGRGEENSYIGSVNTRDILNKSDATPALLKQLFSGEINKYSVEAFMEKVGYTGKGAYGATDAVIKDFQMMKAQYEAKKNMEILGINESLTDVSNSLENFNKTGNNLNKELSGFGKEASIEIAKGVKEANDKYLKYVKNLDLQKANAISDSQAALTNILKDKSAVDILNSMPELANQIWANMGNPLALAQILEDQTNRTILGIDDEEIKAVRAAGRKFNEVPAYADGGPILTNTVLSTMEGGRLRPYATAGEPGNPESVVPDRNKTVSVNLTIPVYIDGKKITDVVVNRILPLNT